MTDSNISRINCTACQQEEKLQQNDVFLLMSHVGPATQPHTYNSILKATYIQQHFKGHFPGEPGLASCPM